MITSWSFILKRGLLLLLLSFYNIADDQFVLDPLTLSVLKVSLRLPFCLENKAAYALG